MFPLLVTFAVLLGGMGLFALARERQRSRRVQRLREAKGSGLALPPAGMDRDVAEFVADARELRLVLEAALQHGEQVDLLDAQLTHPARALRRRPLWLRLEDANYAYDLDHARAAAAGWLAHVEGLDDATRGELARRGLDLGPIRGLAEHEAVAAEGDDETLAEATRAAAHSIEGFERRLASGGLGTYR